MASPNMIDVISPSGEYGSIPAENLEAAIKAGYKQPSSKEQKVEEFKDSGVLAGAAGLARGLSVGLSDQALTKTGLVEPETLSALEEANPTTSTVGEVVSLFVPGAGILGAAGKGIKAISSIGLKAEEATRKALQSISRGSNNKIVKSIIERGLPKGVGSAVEGAAFGAGQLVSEEALGNLDFNAEGITSTVLPSAILSGAVGGIIGQISPIVGAGLKPVKDNVGGYLGAKSKDVYKQIVDEKEAALDLLGATPAQKQKIIEKYPDVYENLPRFFRENAELGYNKTVDDMSNSINKAKQKASDDIYIAIEDLDKTSLKESAFVDRAELFDKIANKLDEKFISPNTIRVGDEFVFRPNIAPSVKSIKKMSDTYKMLSLKLKTGGKLEDADKLELEEFWFSKPQKLKKAVDKVDDKTKTIEVPKELDENQIKFINELEEESVKLNKELEKIKKEKESYEKMQDELNSLKKEKPSYKGSEKVKIEFKIKQLESNMKRMTSSTNIDEERIISKLKDNKLSIDQVLKPTMQDKTSSYKSNYEAPMIQTDTRSMTFKNLVDEKRLADSVAKYDTSVDNLMNSARKDIASVIREEMYNTADKISKKGSLLRGAEDVDSLVNKFKKANLDYRIAETIDEIASKKASKQTLISASDILIPGASGAIGGMLGDEEGATIGTAIGATSRFLKSDLSKKVAILSGIEKKSKDLNKMIDKAAKNITEYKNKIPVERPATSTAMSKVLSESQLAYNRSEDGNYKKPSNEQEAYRNISKNIDTIMADPNLLQKRLENSFRGLSAVAPQTAAQGMQVSIAALNFLASKLPKNNTMLGTIQTIKKQQKISSIEMGRLKSYLTVIDDPTIVFRKIESGSLDRPSIEALRAVYPNIYNTLRDKTTEYLSNNAENIPYTKRVQLGILLDVPADTSLTPGMFNTLQGSFVTKEEQDAPAPKNMEITNTMQTQNEKALSR